MVFVRETFEIKEDGVHDCLDKAFVRLRSYFIRYHPAGYGTRAELNPIKDGLEVIVTRYASCD
jgi:hypothetical protein